MNKPSGRGTWLMKTPDGASLPHVKISAQYCFVRVFERAYASPFLRGGVRA